MSGYDLNKLHYGAHGSLGVIVEASFKLFPQPKHAQSVTMSNDLQTTWSEATRALELKQRPVALEVRCEGGAECTVTAMFTGEPAAVTRMTEELGWGVAPDDYWTQTTETATAHWARISVDIEEMLSVVERLPNGSRWHAQRGVGIIDWFDAADAAAVERVRAAAVERGGRLVLVAGDADLKRRVGAWGPTPAGMNLMRGMKDAFDPEHTLSPGRYII